MFCTNAFWESSNPGLPKKGELNLILVIFSISDLLERIAKIITEIKELLYLRAPFKSLF